MPTDIVIQGIPISDTRVDSLTAANKALWGSLPGVGTILSEVINSIVPQQRIERIAAVLKIFDDKIQRLEMGAEVLRNLMTAETFVDLFEDGVFQAARALSDERRRYIASFLVSSLSQSELNHIQEKKLLNLLGQINDIEIIFLMYASTGNAELKKLHPHILNESPDHRSVDLDRADIDQAMRVAYIDQLKSLRLLKSGNATPDSTYELPYLEATRLGKMLIKYIDSSD